VSFLVGAAFFLFAHLARLINFSLSYESAELRSWFNLTAYVNFCLRLLLIFGLVFELPVVAAILARLGLITGPLFGPTAEVRRSGERHRRGLSRRPHHHGRHLDPALPQCTR